MKQYYSAAELANLSLEGMPRTTRGVQKKAERENSSYSFKYVQLVLNLVLILSCYHYLANDNLLFKNT